jgi:tetratricopeptide (TPR) repeat protein
MRAISLLLLFWLQSDPLTEGLAQFHRGDYAAAEKSLAAALKNRDDPRARAFLALTRASTGRCEQAESELSAQLESSTDREVRRLAGLGLAQCRVAQSRFDDALVIVSRLKSLYPADADVLYQTARLYMRAWNDTVYEMYRKTPASFRVNQLSGEIFETQGNYAAAIAEYRKAIEKNPKTINLHFRLGRAILMESHSPEALAQALPEFEAELALNARDAAAEYQVGQILLAQQKSDSASARFTRALQINPEFPEALIALGKLQLDAKRHDEAIRLLERAVKLMPKSEAARYSLMLAYRNAGRGADALREKAELEKLQKAPEGEFTDFLKKLGETGKK